MPIESGDVVLVPFPFTNQRASKKRPAVVVSNRAYSTARPDLVVMVVTSQLRPDPGLGATRISHWQEAGCSSPPIRDETYGEDDDSEDKLVERWTPRFR